MNNSEDQSQQISSLKQQLKDAQAHIMKLEHLVNFGESAADIAHEINNPVNLALNSAEITERSLKYFNILVNHYQELFNEGVNIEKKKQEIIKFENEVEIELVKEEFNHAVKSIVIALSRVQEIGQNLNIFGSLNQLVPIKFNINKSLNETLLIIQKNCIDKIEIRKKLQEIPIIDSYRGKLNQVFINIIKNSIEAIMEKNELVNEFILVETFSNDSNVIVKIEDSGIGMTNDTREKLFTKFYTTKSPNKGTGLGMAVSKKIIEQHNGSIEVNSVRGEGTEFKITVPIKQQFHGKV